MFFLSRTYIQTLVFVFTYLLFPIDELGDLYGVWVVEGNFKTIKPDGNYFGHYVCHIVTNSSDKIIRLIEQCFDELSYNRVYKNPEDMSKLRHHGLEKAVLIPHSSDRFFELVLSGASGLPLKPSNFCLKNIRNVETIGFNV